MTESQSTEAGKGREEDFRTAQEHEDAALPDTGEWSMGGEFGGPDGEPVAASTTGMRQTGERLQKFSTASPEDWHTARREEIARRSNEFYTRRASLAARQQKRNRRITLFVCVTAALAALAMAAPIALQTYAPGYMEGLLDHTAEPQQASLAGSGSVYMTPPPPPREPATPVQARTIAPQAVPPKKPSGETAATSPAEATASLIEPTSEQMPAADPGLLYEAATRPDFAGAIAAPEGALDAKPSAAKPAAVLDATPDTKPAAKTVEKAEAPVLPAGAAAGKPSSPAGQIKVAALEPAATIPAAPAARSMTAPTKAPAMAADEARQLLERGDRLMKLGDIVSARALYTRALDADQANAALRLGSTFDPLIYQRIGVRGLQPDAGKAMEWYLTAAEAGNENARRAYDALKRATAQQ